MSGLNYSEAAVQQSVSNVVPEESGVSAPTSVLNGTGNDSPSLSLLPERPCSAVFAPGGFVGAVELVNALDRCHISKEQVRCLQRLSAGKICVTFCNPEVRNNFVKNSVFEVRGRPVAIQDVDHPLTFLRIHEAPHELPNAAIVHRLTEFCDVVHYRRGYFTFDGLQHIMDGVRHYRVRLNKPTPSFLRFGRVQIHLRYEGQTITCRQCNEPGHMANDCHVEKICFNCDGPGHVSSECPHPVCCHFCHEEHHKTRECPFSWCRPVSPTSPRSVKSEEELVPPTSPVSVLSDQTDTDDFEDVPDAVFVMWYLFRFY